MDSFIRFDSLSLVKSVGLNLSSASREKLHFEKVCPSGRFISK